MALSDPSGSRRDRAWTSGAEAVVAPSCKGLTALRARARHSRAQCAGEPMNDLGSSERGPRPTAQRNGATAELRCTDSISVPRRAAWHPGSCARRWRREACQCERRSFGCDIEFAQ